MSGHLRHRLHRVLRTASLLVLAACLLLQPTLGAVGQVHDVFEHLDDTAQHHESPAFHAGEDDGKDAGDAIHVLLHYAHCCAPATAVFPVVPQVALRVDASGTLLPMDDARHAQALPGHPFRPPIAV